MLQVFLAGALAQRQVGLHAQTRQRRLELVCRVSEKPLLRANGVFQPGQQVVDGGHQRRHLQRHRLFVKRTQIVRPARPDALFQLAQGLDAAHQGHPDQQHGQRQGDELGQHHALDDFGREDFALLSCFGHLNQRGLSARHIQLYPD
jgi:hypothetical protein